MTNVPRVRARLLHAVLDRGVGLEEGQLGGRHLDDRGARCAVKVCKSLMARAKCQGGG